MKAIATMLVFVFVSSGAALAGTDNANAASQPQAPAAPATTTPRGNPPGRVAPPPAETPQPAMALPASRAYVQGFSIVLVQGDLTASTTTDDVPAAARKALTDMREFLPFKSYRLLDAAWVLCCGHDARRESNLGRVGLRDTRAVKQILRGGEGQEFEVALTTYRVEGNRIFVSFSLENPTRTAEELSMAAAHGEEINELNKKKQALERELAARRSAGETKTEDYSRIQSEVGSLSNRINDLRSRGIHASTGQRRTTFHEERKPLIDTTFTMDVGETVVVGTSRMKGASRALIALLTAVPPRSGERRE
jgi:hypothetical protein